MVGVLSDDLTGANGVAAMFVARGWPAFTLLGPLVSEKAPAIPLSGSTGGNVSAGVLVVDTASRDAAPDDAFRMAHAAALLLRDAGATRIAKRIDSTLRGAIGAETAAVLEALGGRVTAVVVPAAPEAGRVAVHGRVFIHGRPLSEVMGGPDQPLPLISGQAGLAARALGIETVRRGPPAVAESLADAAAAGIPIVVCDAETPDDVRAIARGLMLSGIAAVSVDPGGFTVALADPTPLPPLRSAGPPLRTPRRALRGEGRRLYLRRPRVAQRHPAHSRCSRGSVRHVRRRHAIASVTSSPLPASGRGSGGGVSPSSAAPPAWLPGR
jgi:uncharacterized protein YgbK (DUF1537 family)